MRLLHRLLLLFSIVSFILLLSLAVVRAQGIGDTPLYLECGIVNVVPKDNDPDPPYKIDIVLVPRNGHIAHVDVRFTVVSGAVYARSNQYSGVMISESYEGGMPVISWYGRWNKNPSVLMMGRIWRNGLRAGYNEMQQRGPQVSMAMTSLCHFTDDRFTDDSEPKGD